MNNSCSKAAKIKTISYSKEGAHTKRAFTVICLIVKAEVGVYYSCNIIFLASRRE